jgi:hypothetical protein
MAVSSLSPPFQLHILTGMADCTVVAVAANTTDAVGTYVVCAANMLFLAVLFEAKRLFRCWRMS